MSEDNKTIAERFNEDVWGRGDEAALEPDRVRGGYACGPRNAGRARVQRSAGGATLGAPASFYPKITHLSDAPAPS